MGLMKFEVPQFIEIEDKIFGPFTWRQFLYLGGGLGIAVTLFLAAPFILFAIFGLPIALLAAALAFYPINNRPFSYFLEAVFNYLVGNRLYLWRQENKPIYTSQPTAPMVPSPGTRPSLERQENNINSLARKLELQAIQKEK